MTTPRSPQWRDWVGMGSNPGFDPSYNAAVSGGSPDAWRSFRDYLFSVDPAMLRRQGMEQLARFERDDAEASQRRRGGGRQASPLPQVTDDEARLVADMRAAGKSQEQIDAAVALLRGGAQTSDQIRQRLGLDGGGGAPLAQPGPSDTPADSIPAITSTFSQTGPEERAAGESERGLSWEKVYEDALAKFLPNFVAPDVRNAFNRASQPLEAKFRAGQALGEISPETSLRDYLPGNLGSTFNMSNASGLASNAYDQIKRLGGLLRAEEIDPRLAGAVDYFAAPENQANTLAGLLGQTVAPHLRAGLTRYINRDFERFRAPGGGQDYDYFSDFYGRHGQ